MDNKQPHESEIKTSHRLSDTPALVSSRVDHFHVGVGIITFKLLMLASVEPQGLKDDNVIQVVMT